MWQLPRLRPAGGHLPRGLTPLRTRNFSRAFFVKIKAPPACEVLLAPHGGFCAGWDSASDRYVQIGGFVLLMEPFHHRRPSDPTAVADSVRNTQAPLFREYERSTSPLAISYRLGINPPCVAQCSPSAESMSVAGHARSSLRRSCCAAYGAEFFLYEKMGRRAIVHEGSGSEAGSTSEVGGRAQAPIPTPPQKDGNPRGASSPWRELESRALEVFPAVSTD